MTADQLWRNYNLTEAEVAAIHAAQGGLCLVCGRDLVLGSPSVCIDHCHKTGIVRGLLCFLCNRALGLLGDDIIRLYAAVAYIKAPPAPVALGENRFACLGRGPQAKAKSRSRQPDFYGRFDRPSSIERGTVYRCGCIDYGARPLKACPVHKQLAS